MSIPLYAAMAHGGKIVSLDDQSVMKDLAALAGTGGTAFTAYIVSTEYATPKAGGYGKLRRAIQRVPHDGSVSVAVTPWRDGSDTGQTITKSLGPSDNRSVVAPLNVTGSSFQIKVALSTFDAAAALGAGELTLIRKRTVR